MCGRWISIVVTDRCLLQASSSDISKQLLQIKTLKQDNAILEEKTSQLHESFVSHIYVYNVHVVAPLGHSCDLTSPMLCMRGKVKSLGRDNVQKRIVAKDMKMKVKIVQEKVKSDAAVKVCLKAVALN